MAASKEAGDLAAYLRVLKDRTELSYEALARRLNISASTLHRYCAGATVPVAPAPLKRLGLLCGASPQELTELHRLWVLADSARREPGSGRRSDRPAPVGNAGGERSPAEPWRSTEHQESTDPTGAVMRPATELPIGRQPVDRETYTARGDRTDRRPDGPTTEPAADTGKPSALPSSGTTTQEAASPEATPPKAASRQTTSPVLRARRWLRHNRRATRAGAALTAMAALLTADGLSAEPGRGPAHPALGLETPSADTRGARQAPAPDGAFPSVSSTGPEPKPGSPSRTASVSPGTAPAGQYGTGGRANGGNSEVPLAWSTRSHVWAYGCDHTYLIDRGTEVPPPPSGQDAAVWAAAMDAVHGGDTNVRISVQGTSSAAVVLESLTVRVVSRDAPVERDAYEMNDGCGGALSPRYFDVDLDRDRPVAHPRAGSDAGRALPAVRFPYRVSSTDPEVLLVTARTAHCDCRWYLELEWSSQGRSGTLRVDDGERPFRTSAAAGLPAYGYDTATRRWVHTGSDGAGTDPGVGDDRPDPSGG